jgi:hypothetical protein
MTEPAETVSVYDGDQFLGFVARRHWVAGLAVAFEAIDAGEQFVGFFQTQEDAAGALWRSARGQQPGRPTMTEGAK